MTDESLITPSAGCCQCRIRNTREGIRHAAAAILPRTHAAPALAM